MTQPISGVAAGVPFTALPPSPSGRVPAGGPAPTSGPALPGGSALPGGPALAGGSALSADGPAPPTDSPATPANGPVPSADSPVPPVGGPAPLVVAWHLLDAPCTDAAFAAALPLNGVPAWRVYLGLPLCGARSLPNGQQAIVELAREDIVLRYVDNLVRQAAGEFPAALAEIRARFEIADGPIGVVGGSLGGAVASLVLAERPVPIAAGALLNAAIRARSVAAVVERGMDEPYVWTDASRAAADRLDFVARADELADVPVLVVSGERDHPPLRADAVELAGVLPKGRLVSVPGLDHPLAERPGVEPAPQIPNARVVDRAVTDWFNQYLPG
jgi:pimeloyl-ACP methyl ester carboxylesterase